MKNFHYLPTILVAATVTLLSVVRQPNVAVGEVIDKFNIDKLLHLLIYAFLMLVATYDTKRAGHTLDIKTLTAVSVSVIAFGGVIELIQNYFCSYRTGSWYDFLFNTLGVLTALLITKFIHHKDEN